MKYPVLPYAHALKSIELHQQGQGAAIEEFVASKGAGLSFETDAIEALSANLWALTKKYDTPTGHLARKDQRGGEFEARACEVAHQTLSLPRAVACDGEFWLWLTLVAQDGTFARLVDWRFGPVKHVANYGATTPGSFREGLMARLWWRGEIGHRAEDVGDPYALARTGDQDIWRSHIFRTRYGRNRDLAREFLMTIYDGAKRRQSGAVERKFAKLTRARHASTAIEVLDASAKRRLLGDLAQDAVRSIDPTDAE
jgi:hypothetical protein